MSSFIKFNILGLYWLVLDLQINKKNYCSCYYEIWNWGQKVIVVDFNYEFGNFKNKGSLLYWSKRLFNLCNIEIYRYSWVTILIFAWPIIVLIGIMLEL